MAVRYRWPGSGSEPRRPAEMPGVNPTDRYHSKGPGACMFGACVQVGTALVAYQPSLCGSTPWSRMHAGMKRPERPYPSKAWRPKQHRETERLGFWYACHSVHIDYPGIDFSSVSQSCQAICVFKAYAAKISSFGKMFSPGLRQVIYGAGQAGAKSEYG
jgi:hypothetical protein